MCLAMVLAGVGWIVLATLMNMSSRQLAIDSRLRATMLGVFLSVFYLGMSVGSVTWGLIAKLCPDLSGFDVIIRGVDRGRPF